MNCEFRIDIDGTRRNAEKLDELKRCAQEIAWRLEDAKNAEMNDPHSFAVYSRKAEALSRYFQVLYNALMEISDDAQWTGRKIEAILEEYSLPNTYY